MIGGRGRIKVVDGCHLMINSVNTDDAGNYTCYVSNIAATKSVSVMLTVAGSSSRLIQHVLYIYTNQQLIADLILFTAVEMTVPTL